MNGYDTVVIAYDKNIENLKMATALRGMLECFGLNVYLLWLNERQNVVDFLARKIPDTEYVVLCAHGVKEDDRIRLDVLEKIEGTDYSYERVEMKDRTGQAPWYPKDCGVAPCR